MLLSNLKYDEYKNVVPKEFQHLKCRAFNLRIPHQPGFFEAKRKCLVIIDHVPTRDLKEGALLHGEVARQTMSSILSLSKRWASHFATEGLIDYKFGFINFNYFKSYHLKDSAWKSAQQQAAKRVRKYIEKVKPDMILVFGDDAAKELLPKTEYLIEKHGWVHRYKGKNHKCNMVTTIDFDPIYPGENDEELKVAERTQIDLSNLIGYVFKSISSIYLNRLPLSLKGVKPEPYLVDTKAKFKKMMRLLKKHKGGIAVDTETENLNVVKNTLLTVQFAIDTKRGYIVPISHKDTPFTAKELRYVKRELAKFFYEDVEYKEEKPRFLIYHNGKFDIRILKQFLGVPFISWPLWDTQAGEFLLEENMGSLITFRYKPYNLGNCYLRYGNDFYQNAEFGKQNRATIKDVDLKRPVLEYMSMDVQGIVGLQKIQQLQANVLKLDNEPYGPYFQRMMLLQMNNTIHTMSNMIQRGVTIDHMHLLKIKSKGSPLLKLVDKVYARIYKRKAAKKANELLLKKSNIPTKGLFGKVRSKWLLNIDEQKHQQLLFIQVLGLEPISVNEDTGQASLNKAFQKKHEKVREVALLTKRNKIRILYNMFAKGIYNKVSASEDARMDGRLRPSYGYEGVVSGRSNSYDPNLQQIPQHSEWAKVIKRLFVAPVGRIKIKLDYSAHEVRCWGIVSRDKAIAEVMDRINKLVYDLRKNVKKHQDETELKRLKTEGDVHRQNYSLFSGKKVSEVNDEERQGAKGITFGSMYGMSAKSLAENIKKTVKEAKDLMNRFFSKFVRARKWLDWTADFARTNGYTFNPNGRRRNLWAAFTGHERLLGGIGRRAQNAPIQAFASDMVFNAARLIEIGIFKAFKKLGKVKLGDAMTSTGVNVMVHDSIEAETEYGNVMLVLWIMEYSATLGLKDFIQNVLKVPVNTEFAVEFEIGSIGSNMGKWNWTDIGLEKLIRTALEDQKKELGHELDVDKVLKVIYDDGVKHLPYLQKKFPLKVHPLINYAETGKLYTVGKTKKKKAA